MVFPVLFPPSPLSPPGASPSSDSSFLPCLGPSSDLDLALALAWPYPCHVMTAAGGCLGPTSQKIKLLGTYAPLSREPN